MDNRNYGIAIIVFCGYGVVDGGHESSIYLKIGINMNIVKLEETKKILAKFNKEWADCGNEEEFGHIPYIEFQMANELYISPLFMITFGAVPAALYNFTELDLGVIMILTFISIIVVELLRRAVIHVILFPLLRKFKRDLRLQPYEYSIIPKIERLVIMRDMQNTRIRETKKLLVDGLVNDMSLVRYINFMKSNASVKMLVDGTLYLPENNHDLLYTTNALYTNITDFLISKKVEDARENAFKLTEIMW